MRIGLSATQKPIEEVAHFLTGNAETRPDPVIVNIGHKRKLDLAVEVPPMPLGPVASNEMWDEIYDRLVALVGAASVDAGVCEHAADGGARVRMSWASASAKRMWRRIMAACRASCGWRRRRN